jgi:hypothetical protein
MIVSFGGLTLFDHFERVAYFFSLWEARVAGTIARYRLNRPKPQSLDSGIGERSPRRRRASLSQPTDRHESYLSTIGRLLPSKLYSALPEYEQVIVTEPIGVTTLTEGVTPARVSSDNSDNRSA